MDKGHLCFVTVRRIAEVRKADLRRIRLLVCHGSTHQFEVVELVCRVGTHTQRRAPLGSELVERGSSSRAGRPWVRCGVSHGDGILVWLARGHELQTLQ
jgi:hypothetical protein